jgi:ubiquinone/menaquinone biosynthesis C-methylase UbiE
VKAYYDARAPEYDDWWHWHGEEHPDETSALLTTIESLETKRTLDVACGTGFLTRHLQGDIVGLDASETMLKISQNRVPNGEFVSGEALELPFADKSFDRVFTGHFYGHLEDKDRQQFLAEARRVAPELVVVDSAVRPDSPPESMQERMLRDGSRWEVFKRYFTGAGLAEELGGGAVLFEGRWFVVVRSPA